MRSANGASCSWMMVESIELRVAAVACMQKEARVRK